MKISAGRFHIGNMNNRRHGCLFHGSNGKTVSAIATPKLKERTAYECQVLLHPVTNHMFQSTNITVFTQVLGRGFHRHLRQSTLSTGFMVPSKTTHVLIETRGMNTNTLPSKLSVPSGKNEIISRAREALRNKGPQRPLQAMLHAGDGMQLVRSSAGRLLSGKVFLAA